MTARTLAELKAHVLGVLLPRWHERGRHPEGGFHERLDRDLAPIDLGYRRLLSQCRQVFTFSEGALLGAPAWAAEDALAGFEHLCASYHDGERGGWRFALGVHPSVPADTRDLYAHAFVLLACASVHRLSGSARALATARSTLDFVRARFAAPSGGFHDALDGALCPVAGVRRQNPHMHLLEGCLMMYDASGDPAYADLADEVLRLFDERFFDARTGTLGEYFDEHLAPHPESGCTVEPGHHFEWVWLLHRRARLPYRGPRTLPPAHLLARAEQLLAFALQHGLDRRYGGFFDAVDRSGAVLADTKRIWPVTEALKAFRCAGGACEPHFQHALDLLFERYFRGESGGWSEVLRRDLAPDADHLPATTLYHVMMALRETAPSEG